MGAVYATLGRATQLAQLLTTIYGAAAQVFVDVLYGRVVAMLVVPFSPPATSTLPVVFVLLVAPSCTAVCSRLGALVPVGLLMLPALVQVLEAGS